MNKRIRNKIMKRERVTGKSFSINNVPNHNGNTTQDVYAMLTKELTLLGQNIQALQQIEIDKHADKLEQFKTDTDKTVENKLSRITLALSEAESE